MHVYGWQCGRPWCMSKGTYMHVQHHSTPSSSPGDTGPPNIQRILQPQIKDPDTPTNNAFDWTVTDRPHISRGNLICSLTLHRGKYSTVWTPWPLKSEEGHTRQYRLHCSQPQTVFLKSDCGPWGKSFWESNLEL